MEINLLIRLLFVTVTTLRRSVVKVLQSLARYKPLPDDTLKDSQPPITARDCPSTVTCYGPWPGAELCLVLVMFAGLATIEKTILRGFSLRGSIWSSLGRRYGARIDFCPLLLRYQPAPSSLQSSETGRRLSIYHKILNAWTNVESVYTTRGYSTNWELIVLFLVGEINRHMTNGATNVAGRLKCLPNRGSFCANERSGVVRGGR